ncbi:MAG: helix-turn-helix domain-containing protein [Rhodospirillaceae bacterium]|nr:helix-turn-helix domain-containing protein [Rhodospirillaceae bacterium]
MKKNLYHYRLSGLDGIYLADGYEIVETHRGRGIVFHDLAGLHRAIGRHLVLGRRRLSGKELRFLRKDMGLIQAELARLLGVSSQQVARWEKGQCAMPGTADTMVRLLYAEHIGQPATPSTVLRVIDGLPPRAPKREVFTAARGWRVARAA